MNTQSFLVSIIYMVTITANIFCTIQAKALNKFTLITTLYNEKNPKRCSEFITCIETNLKNTSIEAIHVAYDTAKDDAQVSMLLNYLKSKNIKISYISERASYGTLFEIANRDYPNCKIIVCNGDIFFNETLALLETIDLNNKFLALTRWDAQADGTLKEAFPNGGSQDAWIFQAPLRTFENSSIKMGIWGCENAIAYQAQKSGLTLVNPSLSIQCCHLHMSEIRNYQTKDSPYKNVEKIIIIPKCTVMELNDNQRTLFLDHLMLRAGRRAPIILSKV